MTGFRQLLRAEWTKLRSVRRWVLALVAVVLLSVGFGLFGAANTDTNANEFPDFVVGPNGRPVTDEFEFVHQPLAGDGTLVARVASQDDSHEWASAGVMIKDGVRPGARYAALLVTPRHGVRLSANFDPDVAGSDGGTAPRWLKLTRAGSAVTGYESSDGVTWREVGSVDVGELPSTVQAGVFVSSPPKITVKRSAGSTSVGGRGTVGTATFDNVRVESATGAGQAAAWTGDEVRNPVPGKPGAAVVYRWSETSGVFTVSGSGEIGPRESPDDMVQSALFGILIGLIVIAAIGVLYVTSEFKRGMIRTTFAVTPHRGAVLAAKAVVLGVTAFVLGLVASLASFLLGLPLLKSNGFAPPAYPTPSLSEGPVLRAVILTAAFVALVALLGLGLGATMRRSAGAITTVLTLVILPTFVAIALPSAAAEWLMRLTPAGGFAAQRAKPPSVWLAEPWSMLGPWEGLGVVAAYAAAALLAGGWLLRRRDA
jgi:ABC-2 family transporter protein